MVSLTIPPHLSASVDISKNISEAPYDTNVVYMSIDSTSWHPIGVFYSIVHGRDRDALIFSGSDLIVDNFTVDFYSTATQTHYNCTAVTNTYTYYRCQGALTNIAHFEYPGKYLKNSNSSSFH